MMRTSIVPKRGCRRASHHRKVGSGKGLAAQQQVDRRDVVSVVEERARDPDPREGLEERRAGGGQAGLATLPEGRVGRQREQQRQVRAPAVDRAQRAVGVGHRHVHVQREGRLAPRELAHRPVQEAVAVAVGDLRVLPQRERVQAGDGRAQVEQLELPREVPA